MRGGDEGWEGKSWEGEEEDRRSGGRRRRFEKDKTGREKEASIIQLLVLLHLTSTVSMK
jgi:hypothetical protein